MQRYLSAVLAALALCLLAGCAQALEAVLPLSRAWVDGRQVEYVTTDISDAAMARAAGVNYVPRLARAVAQTGAASLLERVYKFTEGEQISIFQSAPRPTGGGNADADYSPLWRLATVRWVQRQQVRELKSEAELLAAEDAGEVFIAVTGIVVNCPITRGPDGLALAGVR